MKTILDYATPEELKLYFVLDSKDEYRLTDIKAGIYGDLYSLFIARKEYKTANKYLAKFAELADEDEITSLQMLNSGYI